MGMLPGGRKRRIWWSTCSTVTYFSICLALMLHSVSNSALAETSPAARIERIAEIVDALRSQLGITENVRVRMVEANRLAFSVQPYGHDEFLLKVDTHFLVNLDDDEMTAALAHELGHVWIYTHHPFLHTEALANQIALRVVSRDILRRLYSKVSQFEGWPNYDEELLGRNVQ